MLIANIFRQKSKFVSCPVVHSSVNKFLGSSIPSNVVMALLLCKVFTACLLLGEEIQIVHELNASCLTSSLLQCNLFCNTHACCCYSAISDLPSSNMHACMLRLEEKIKVHFRRKIMLKDLCQYFTGSSGEKTKLCLIYQKSLSSERIKIQNVL